jgi:hypothetical protein
MSRFIARVNFTVEDCPYLMGDAVEISDAALVSRLLEASLIMEVAETPRAVVEEIEEASIDEIEEVSTPTPRARKRT